MPSFCYYSVILGVLYLIFNKNIKIKYTFVVFDGLNPKYVSYFVV
jgi:hypothetical protein